MTECLGPGGRPGQEVGVERWEGRRGGDLAGVAETHLFIFPDWKKAVRAAHICRESRYLLRFLPQQISFCHSVRHSLYFFIARAQQTVGAPPHPHHLVLKNTHTSPGTPKAQLTWAAGVGGWRGACCSEKPMFRQTVSPPWKCLMTPLAFPARTVS